jgi:hypothetical protein
MQDGGKTLEGVGGCTLLLFQEPLAALTGLFGHAGGRLFHLGAGLGSLLSVIGSPLVVLLGTPFMLLPEPVLAAVLHSPFPGLPVVGSSLS